MPIPDETLIADVHNLLADNTIDRALILSVRDSLPINRSSWSVAERIALLEGRPDPALFKP